MIRSDGLAKRGSPAQPLCGLATLAAPGVGRANNAWPGAFAGTPTVASGGQGVSDSVAACWPVGSVSVTASSLLPSLKLACSAAAGSAHLAFSQASTAAISVALSVRL